MMNDGVMGWWGEGRQEEKGKRKKEEAAATSILSILSIVSIIANRFSLCDCGRRGYTVFQ